MGGEEAGECLYRVKSVNFGDEFCLSSGSAFNNCVILIRLLDFFVKHEYGPYKFVLQLVPEVQEIGRDSLQKE